MCSPSLLTVPEVLLAYESAVGSHIRLLIEHFVGFLVAQLGKNPPAMWETWVQSLGWEDPPWTKAQLPSPAFWPGELHGLVPGVTKSQTRLSNFHFQVN